MTNLKVEREVFRLDHLYNESNFAKEARKMFSAVETTDWTENCYNVGIAQTFITNATNALPLETIVQMASIYTGVPLKEEDMTKHLARWIKMGHLRKRTGKGLSRGVTLYEINFK